MAEEEEEAQQKRHSSGKQREFQGRVRGIDPCHTVSNPPAPARQSLPPISHLVDKLIRELIH